jgi:hypothetical protein
MTSERTPIMVRYFRLNVHGIVLDHNNRLRSTKVADEAAERMLTGVE